MGRLAILPSLHIKEFSGGTITKASCYAINAVYSRYPDGNPYATQRPGVNIFEDASATTSDAKGRGVYFWQKNTASYAANDTKVYKASYSGTTWTITTGTKKVYFFEIGDYLVIADPENNEAWQSNIASAGTLTAISLPAALTDLAEGGVSLNGKLYLADATTGDIFESDIEDPTTWGALNFRNAEIKPDPIVYIGEHHQHVIALGMRSLEFFYDAANPTGSTLSPRTDVDFSIGAVQRTSFWEEADLLFWVGYTESGGIAVYSLQSFVPNKISTPDIDTFLGSAITADNIQLLGSGFQVGGRIYYLLTLYNLVTTVQPTVTLVYELVSGKWYLWSLEHSGIDDAPLVAWTKATTTRLGQGILSNGDLVSIADDNDPQDTVGTFNIFESGVFEAGVFSNTAFSGIPITMELVHGPKDMGTRDVKFESELRLISTPTDATQTLTVEVSDEADNSWEAARSLDTSEQHSKLLRNGRYRQRNRRLIYAGTEQYRIEGIETRERSGTS